MKNSTLSRKPGHDMRKDQGLYKPVRGVSQAGDGADFAFNGQMGDGVNRAKDPYAKNQWSGHSNDGRDVNFGRGPTVGNASSSPKHGGVSVTKDKHAMTIATAAQGGRIDGGTTVKGFGNPNSINVGMKK